MPTPPASWIRFPVSEPALVCEASGDLCTGIHLVLPSEARGLRTPVAHVGPTLPVRLDRFEREPVLLILSPRTHTGLEAAHQMHKKQPDKIHSSRIRIEGKWNVRKGIKGRPRRGCPPTLHELSVSMRRESTPPSRQNAEENTVIRSHSPENEKPRLLRR